MNGTKILLGDDISEKTKHLLKSSLPITINNLIRVSSSFILILFIAKLGIQYLSAGALINSTLTTIWALCSSMFAILPSKISYFYTSRKHEEIKALICGAKIIGVGLSIISIVIMWNIGPILTFFDQPTIEIKISQSYFNTIWFSFPVIILISIYSQLMLGIGKPIYSMIINGFNLITFSILLYIFLFGFWIIPAYGFSGSAYSSIISWIITLLFIFLIFRKKQYIYKYENFSCNIKQSAWKTIYAPGIQICIQRIFELLTLNLLVYMAGWLGAKPLAMYQIVNQVNFLALIIPFGIGQASMILVSAYLGENKFKSAKTMCKISIWTGLLIILVVVFLLKIFSYNIIAYYLPKNYSDLNTIIKTTSLIFSIMLITLTIDCIRNIFIANLRAYNDTKIPMIYSLVPILFIGLPLSYLLAFYYNFGIAGVLYGNFVGVALATLLTGYRWSNITNYLANTSSFNS